jgi:ubiquinone/menaquinone biosynthesis C-methylase UbiE
MIRDLIEKNYEYFGIDMSDQMIEEARAMAAGLGDHKIHLLAGDVAKIGYPDNCFDGVIALGLLEYLSDLNSQFKEIKRVMKPGGFLVVTAPLKCQLDRFMVYSLTPFRMALAPLYHRLKKISPRAVKRFYFSPRGLDAAAENAGFKKVDFAYYNFTVLPYPFTVLFPRATYLFNSKWERFCKAFYLAFLSTGYIAKYEKITD